MISNIKIDLLLFNKYKYIVFSIIKCPINVVVQNVVCVVGEII